MYRHFIIRGLTRQEAFRPDNSAKLYLGIWLQEIHPQADKVAAQVVGS